MKSLAIADLIEQFNSCSPEELVKQFGAEELRELQEQVAAIEHDQLDRRCAEDPLYWAHNHTATENPKWEEQGLPFRAPFPRKSYFEPVFAAFKSDRRLFIAKTREMLTSWCTMIWATSRAQWHKGEVIVQTATEEKAKRLCEYASILYRNQPEWLRARHPLKSDAALGLEWEDGGKLFGIPSGDDKVRMYHPSVMIFDEAAFLPGAESCYNAANPVAGQIIAISSAGPGWFADECSL
jgi:hypothetical protein